MMRGLVVNLVLACTLLAAGVLALGARWIDGQADKKDNTVQRELESRTCAFVALRDFAAWEKTTPAAGETALVSPEIALPIPANEIVVSWNADAPADTGLEVEARAVLSDRPTKWYSLGRWSRDDGRFPRE